MAAKKNKQLRPSKLTLRKKPACLFNPFDVHFNHTKHQVLGRRDKGQQGLPGRSRQKSLQKRKNSLLYEYKTKDKSNQFIDHRIGEKNLQMSEEDKIMARFARERIHTYKKKSIFNLSDSEVLTHHNRILSEIDKFEENISDDDNSDDNGTLKGEFVKSAHFGGGLMMKSNINREVLISELINEAKKRKADKQLKKEETLAATERLDDEWETLKTIVTPTTVDSETRPKGSNLEYYQNKTDVYNILVNTLKFDLIGKTCHKSEMGESSAIKDREDLQILENQRLKELDNIKHASSCFRNVDDIEISNLAFSYNFNITNLSNQDSKEDISELKSEIEINVENEEQKGKTTKECRKNKSFETEYENCQDSNELKNPSSNYEKAHKIPKSRETHISSFNDLQSSQCESDSEDCCMDDLSDLLPPVEEPIGPNEQESLSMQIKSNKIDKTDHKSRETQISSFNDLQSSHCESDSDDCCMDDLSDLMPAVDEPIGAKQQESISMQIKSNKIDNTDHFEDCSKFKIPEELAIPYVLEVPDNFESFKNVLKKYCNKLESIIDRMIKCNHPSLHPDNGKKMMKLAEYLVQLVSEGEVEWEDLRCLVLYWNYLEKFNGEHCVKLLVDNMYAKLVYFSGLSTFILPTKFLLWLILVCVDINQTAETSVVMKSVLSIACRVVSSLSQFPFENLGETEIECFPFLICFVLLQDAKSSATIYSDVIRFLHHCVEVAVKKIESDDYTFSDIDFNTFEDNVEALNSHDNQFQLNRKISIDQVLRCCVTLLTGFVESYEKHPQSKVLFESVYKTVRQIKVEVHSKYTQKQIKQLQSLLRKLQSVKLVALVKSEKKPKSLRLYDPLFSTLTSSKFKTGLSSEQNEERKLVYKYKQEMKGAIRELRKDRVFLQNVKLKERGSSDEKRRRKVKEILASAAVQEGEWRNFKRVRS